MSCSLSSRFSKIASDPTCMWATGDSTYRNEASCALQRSLDIAGSAAPGRSPETGLELSANLAAAAGRAGAGGGGGWLGRDFGFGGGFLAGDRASRRARCASRHRLSAALGDLALLGCGLAGSGLVR